MDCLTNQPLRLYLRPVLEREPHVVFTVDVGEVHKAEPESFVELVEQSVLTGKFGDEISHRFTSRFLVRHQFGNNLEPCLGGVESRYQTLVAFLIH